MLQEAARKKMVSSVPKLPTSESLDGESPKPGTYITSVCIQQETNNRKLMHARKELLCVSDRVSDSECVEIAIYMYELSRSPTA